MKAIIKVIKEAFALVAIKLSRLCWEGDVGKKNDVFYTPEVRRRNNLFYPVVRWWQICDHGTLIGEPQNSQDEAVKLALKMGRTISV